MSALWMRYSPEHRTPHARVRAVTRDQSNSRTQDGLDGLEVQVGECNSAVEVDATLTRTDGDVRAHAWWGDE